MKILKNYRSNKHGGIDATLDHKVYGDIPYTLTDLEASKLPKNTVIKSYKKETDDI